MPKRHGGDEGAAIAVDGVGLGDGPAKDGGGWAVGEMRDSRQCSGTESLLEKRACKAGQSGTVRFDWLGEGMQCQRLRYLRGDGEKSR